MKTPETLDCHLARDLFVPYLAGDVSPATRAWLDSHLAGCAACRAEFARLSSPSVPTADAGTAPTPSADAGRRVLSRVRLWILALGGALVFSLALVAALLFWVIPAMHTLARMPTTHAAPPAGMSPEQAVRTDLTKLGLTFDRSWETPNGAIAQYKDAAGYVVKLEASHLPTEAEARADYRGWVNAYSFKFMSMQFERPGSDATKFQAGGYYHYAWRTGTWVIAFSIPQDVARAAQLRDQIRDALFTAYQ